MIQKRNIPVLTVIFVSFVQRQGVTVVEEKVQLQKR